MKEPFKWDSYSDQPALLKDKQYKKKMRKQQKFALLKTFLTAIFILPISLLAMPFVKRKEIISEDFFCIGVDCEREPEQSLLLIEELDTKRVLLRFKLWEMQKLQELDQFIMQLQDKKITLKILQDRENIENLELLETNLRKIFTTLYKKVSLFEIGTTINRTKWGFFSVDEYLNFFQVAYNLKKNEFQNIKLIGSGVIDFEYHFTVHTLFNTVKLHYDAVSALLYVDRRGAPEKTQLGFTLSDKIAWLSTLVWISPKTEHKLHITEVNWPINNTAPYAPTSEHECVSEELYADYMLRYYLLAFASQQVDSVSWHQLIAPGFGLIDNRETLRKREAFSTFKFMVKTLKKAQFLRLDIKRDYYILQVWINKQLLQIHWSLKDTTLKNEDFFDVYSKNGEPIKDATLKIGSSPLYIFITKAVGEKINCI